MNSMNNRRRKMQTRHKVATLNLVSLMDIFTILVFFLMVNSSDVEVLQSSSDIKLPDSTSEQQPNNQLVVSVSDEDVIVQGRLVAKIAEVRQSDEPTISGLLTELEYQAGRRAEIPEGGFEVTVMGDKAVPYWLLKKILLTCQTTDFARISLAVNRVDGASLEDLTANTADTAEPAADVGTQS